VSVSVAVSLSARMRIIHICRGIYGVRYIYRYVCTARYHATCGRIRLWCARIRDGVAAAAAAATAFPLLPLCYRPATAWEGAIRSAQLTVRARRARRAVSYTIYKRAFCIYGLWRSRTHAYNSPCYQLCGAPADTFSCPSVAMPQPFGALLSPPSLRRTRIAAFAAAAVSCRRLRPSSSMPPSDGSSTNNNNNNNNA